MSNKNKPAFLVMNVKMINWRWIAITITIVGLAISCSNSNVNTFPNVDAMLCEQKPTPPILTSAEAICFAAYIDGIADSLRAAQKQAKYSGWTVKVQRGQDFKGWEVRIHSKGKILPAYECKLSFTENGTLTNGEPLCGYKK
jgi:hypothetical protein